MDGVRAQPTLRKGARPGARARDAAPVARTVGRYMRSVVHVRHRRGRGDPRRQGRRQDRHGRAARHDQRRPRPGRDPDAPPPVDDTTDTDAWFAAYAPARRPRVAVAVLLVGQGAGGETAAPAARTVLEAALRR